MKDTNSEIEAVLKKAKEYVDDQMEITEEELDNLNAGNTWLARLKSGNRKSPGAWSPRVVTRPNNVLVSRRQLRGIGVHNGK